MNKNNLRTLVTVVILDALARSFAIAVLLREILSSYESFIVHPLDVVNYTGFIHLLIAAVVLLAPLIGYTGDRFGKKKVIVLCLGSGVLAYSSMLLVSVSLVSLVLIFISLNLRFSLVNLVRAVVVDMTTPEQSLPWLVRLATEPFWAIFGLGVTAWVLLYYPIDRFFIMAAIVIELCALGLLFLVRPFTRQSLSTAPLFFWRNFVQSLMGLITDKWVRTWLIAFALLHLAWGIHDQYIFNYSIHVFKVSDMAFAQSTLISYAVAIILGFILFSYLITPARLYRVMLTCVIIKVILLGTWVLPNSIINYLSLILSLQTITTMLLLAGILFAYTQYLPLDYRGLGFGLLAVIWLITWAITGFITDLASFYFAGWPFILAGLFSIALGIWVYKYGQHNILQ